MAATSTLTANSLVNPIGPTDAEIKLDSMTGIVPGIYLYVLDRELMRVVSLGVSPWVKVLRGVAGTSASSHSSGSIIGVGTADQFYFANPEGRPPESVLVFPWVNVLTGQIWIPAGDELPVGLSFRWWQEVTLARAIGALGIRTAAFEPPVDQYQGTSGGSSGVTITPH